MHHHDQHQHFDSQGNTPTNNKLRIRPVDTSRDGRQSVPDKYFIDNDEYVDFIFQVVSQAQIYTLDCDSIVKKLEQMAHPEIRLQKLHHRLQQAGLLDKVDRQVIALSPGYLKDYFAKPENRILITENMFESFAFSYAPTYAAPFNINNLGRKLALDDQNNLTLDPYHLPDARKITERARQRAYEILELAQSVNKRFNLYLSMFSGHSYAGLPEITPENIAEEILYHHNQLPGDTRIIFSDTIGCADNPEKMRNFIEKIVATFQENSIPNPIGLHLHTKTEDPNELVEIFVAAIEPFGGKKEEVYFDLGMGAGGCPYAPHILPNFPCYPLLQAWDKVQQQLPFPVELELNPDFDILGKLYHRAQKVFKMQSALEKEN